MFGHLKEQALLDVVEGRADARAERHVRACAACAARVAQALAGLGLGREADVPEPAPPYWEGFRRELGRRLDAERIPPRVGLPPVWAALAALAVVALGLLAMPPRPADPARDAALPAWLPLPAAGDDAGAVVIEALAPTEDDLAFVSACRGLGCLDGLSEEETRAVAEALRAELAGKAL
jgi:hypothetical protein